MVRQLVAADANAYFELRLRGLVEHPEAFGTTAEEFRRRPLEEIARRMATANAENCTFGAYVDGQLAGVAAFSRPASTKMAHRAGVYQMYVAPEQRGRGLGMQLLAAIVAHARQQPGLEELVLSVTVGNDAALRLYLAAGFRAIYVEPRYIKVDGRAYDALAMVLPLKEEQA